MLSRAGNGTSLSGCLDSAIRRCLDLLLLRLLQRGILRRAVPVKNSGENVAAARYGTLPARNLGTGTIIR